MPDAPPGSSNPCDMDRSDCENCRMPPAIAVGQADDATTLRVAQRQRRYANRVAAGSATFHDVRPAIASVERCLVTTVDEQRYEQQSDEPSRRVFDVREEWRNGQHRTSMVRQGDTLARLIETGAIAAHATSVPAKCRGHARVTF